MSMKFTFSNSIHNTSATVSARGWRLTQRQIRRLWITLCGEADCDCEYGGLAGAQKWRLKKLGGNIDNNGAEITGG